MIRNSIHALKKAVGKVPHTFATVGALTVLTRTFSTGHAATPSVSRARLCGLLVVNNNLC